MGRGIKGRHGQGTSPFYPLACKQSLLTPGLQKMQTRVMGAFHKPLT